MTTHQSKELCLALFCANTNQSRTRSSYFGAAVASQ